MKAFLDTSSLVKLYHEEEGSDFLMNALSHDVTEIFLSELAILEFRSALWKKIREKAIKEMAAIEVISCFQNDGNNFQWIMLQSDIIEQLHGLRRTRDVAPGPAVVPGSVLGKVISPVVRFHSSILASRTSLDLAVVSEIILKKSFSRKGIWGEVHMALHSSLFMPRSSCTISCFS